MSLDLRKEQPPVLPDGPALVFITGRGDTALCTSVDRVAVVDPRDRALCRALLAYATELLKKADADDDQRDRPAVGFQPPKRS